MKRAILLLFTSVMAYAQDYWTDFLEHNRKKAARPWVLLVPERLNQPSWTTDTDFRRLTVLRELQLIVLGPEETKNIWEKKGWDEINDAYWILCSRTESEHTYIAEGIPSAQEIRKLMKKADYIPIADRIDTHLKLYPNDGPANEMNLSLASQLSTARFRDAVSTGSASRIAPNDNVMLGIGGTLKNVEVAEEVFSDYIIAIRRLIEIPDWWRASNRSHWGLSLTYFDAVKSRRMNNIMRKMQYDILSEWQNLPRSELFFHYGIPETFGTIWLHLLTALGDKFELPDVEPCPGDFFPPSSFIDEVASHYVNLGKYDELIKIYDSILLQLPPPENIIFWTDYVTAMRTIWSTKSFAFAALSDKEQCLDALEKAKYWGSSEELQYIHQQIIKSFPNLFTDLEKMMFEPDNFKHLTLPQQPAINQIKLFIADNPGWITEAKKIAKFWTPRQLHIGFPNEQDSSVLNNAIRGQYSWAILQRDRILGYGSDLYTMKQKLQETLQGRQSMYQQLNQYIYKHPFTIEGKINRFRTIQNMYGKDDLFVEMINDALEANMPIDLTYDEWPNYIVLNIRKHIDKVKQVLFRWPYSKNMWEPLISWNKIANIKNLVPDILSQIVFFDEPPIWHGRLPKIIHEEMINKFKTEKKTEELRTWLEVTNRGLEEIKRNIFYSKEYDEELHELIKKYQNTL